MNKLGIAIDISHSGDRTGLDMIKKSKKPVFITHAGLADGLADQPDEGPTRRSRRAPSAAA